jgi:hypothetical protein
MNWFDGMAIGFLLGVLACTAAVVLAIRNSDRDD